jgi:D-glycero-D-manno-heptose 1,7-bisphosphate phosphatase
VAHPQAASGGTRAAAFLDRDGTLIEDRHYIADPHDVVLLPGAAEAVAALNAAGIATVVITNQSGIARGLISETQYAAVQGRLDALLAGHGATLDATYHCPHFPETSGPCDCRKPGTLLYETAIRDLSLDASATTAIGDRWRDLAPALALGGQAILVASPETPPEEIARASREARTARTLGDAVALVIAARGRLTRAGP